MILIFIQGKIDESLPQPYADEMKGLANATGIPLGNYPSIIFGSPDVTYCSQSLFIVIHCALIFAHFELHYSYLINLVYSLFGVKGILTKLYISWLLQFRGQLLKGYIYMTKCVKNLLL